MIQIPLMPSQPFSSLIIFFLFFLAKVFLWSMILYWVEDVDEQLHLENESCSIFTEFKYLLKVCMGICIIFIVYNLQLCVQTGFRSTLGELPYIKTVVPCPLLSHPSLIHLVLAFLSQYDSVLTNVALELLASYTLSSAPCPYLKRQLIHLSYRNKFLKINNKTILWFLCSSFEKD